MIVRVHYCDALSDFINGCAPDGSDLTEACDPLFDGLGAAYSDWVAAVLAGASHINTKLPPASSSSMGLESLGIDARILSRNSGVELRGARSCEPTIAPASENQANPAELPSSTVAPLSFKDRVRTMKQAGVIFGFEKYATTISLFLERQLHKSSIASLMLETRFLLIEIILLRFATDMVGAVQ